MTNFAADLGPVLAALLVSFILDEGLSDRRRHRHHRRHRRRDFRNRRQLKKRPQHSRKRPLGPEPDQQAVDLRPGPPDGSPGQAAIHVQEIRPRFEYQWPVL